MATPNPESPAVSETPEPVTNPEQGTVTPPQEAPVEGKPIEARAGQDGKVYTGLTTEELITELQKRDSHLKSTIAETMQRKEKIRTMETEIEAEKTRKLEADQKYKELWEQAQEKLSLFETLQAEVQETRTRTENEVQKMELLLSATELAEYEIIKEPLPVQNRLEYLKSKMSNRTDISIDNTRGMSGVALKIPETFAEFIALSTDKQKEIKEKYPAEFKKILKTMNP